MCTALALLAVVLKVLVPPGFMIGAGPAAGSPIPLMLCTAQGAVAVDVADRDGGGSPADAPSDSDRHHPPCVFAGAGVAAPPPSLIDAVPVEFAAHRNPVLRPHDAPAPGRGLAAPPPPARGPPDLLI